MRRDLPENDRYRVLGSDQLILHEIGYLFSETLVPKKTQMDGEDVFYLALLYA